MRLRADVTLLFVAAIWGAAFVAQRVAGQMGSIYLFNGVRYLLAALVVLPFALRNTTSAPPPSQYRWMILAGATLFIASALQQAGVVYTTAGNAGFITSLYVVLVPVVLFLGWRERIHWLSVVAVAMAVIGAFLLSSGGHFEARFGDLLELIGALFWAFHVVLLGKFAPRYDAMSFSVGQLTVCSVLNLGVGIAVENMPPWDWSWLGAVAYTAFFSLGLGYTLQVWAQRHTPPMDAALILSLEAVFAVWLGWAILGERLTAIQIVGCALIFSAVLLSQFKEWTSAKISSSHLVEGR